MVADAQITALTARYYELVGSDHHKDRDCHWEIAKSWSYGAEPCYVCRHDGYVSTPWVHGESRPFDTTADAAAELVRALRSAIADLEADDAAS